jgi:hypothetical protein
MGKFLEDTSGDKLLNKLDRIWPDTQKSIEWNELKRLAATTTGYAWHHPKSLDHLRDEMIKKDEWRQSGNGWIERGPFDKPNATVSVEKMSGDKDTGRVHIRVRPVPSTCVVYHSTDGDATENSNRLTTFEFETGDLWHSFLAVDPSGAHPTGSAVVWALQPEIRRAFPILDGKRHVRLEALPTGLVRYTTDGSSLETSGVVYQQPFVAEAGTLIIARAEGKGVIGKDESFTVPADDETVVIDAKKPAVWKRSDGFDGNSTSETYRLLELAKQYGAKLGGMVRLTAAKTGLSELNTFDGTFAPETYIAAIETLRAFIADATVTVSVEELHFPSGRDLEDFANELPLAIGENEVTQSA